MASWRQAGCGCVGASCSHSDVLPLCVVQGEPISLLLAASTTVAGQLVVCEARTQPLGRLILDMTPFATAAVGDPALLSVEVPAEVTADVFTSGVWDAWVGDERVAKGPFLVELGVSRRPGRIAVSGSWSPVLMVGQPFERTVPLIGLLPTGDVAAGGALFSVIGVDGKLAGSWIGPPQVSVSHDGMNVYVALSVEDVAGLGVGRFTYSLGVANQFGERRVVLAGVLTVEASMSVVMEGGDVGG